MLTVHEITELGERLLSMKPDSVPRYLILRDILKASPGDSRFVEAELGKPQSRWIKELAEEQLENGSWGRFHTQDTKVKQKIITTEWAINRGLELGLTKDDEIFQKTVSHMERMLLGQDLPLDREEHHYGFRIALAYIISANLSKIYPEHPLLIQKKEAVAECVRRAFESGAYDEKAYRKAYMELNEVMLNLYTIHPFTLLQSGTDSILPDGLEIKLLGWIWNRPEGIYYITNFKLADYQPLTTGAFYYWLHALDLLSGFKHWPDYAAGAMEFLLGQRGEDGLWDYGPGSKQSVQGHLSDNWRTKNSSKIDCSVKILSLLRKYIDRT